VEIATEIATAKGKSVSLDAYLPLFDFYTAKVCHKKLSDKLSNVVRAKLRNKPNFYHSPTKWREESHLDSRWRRKCLRCQIAAQGNQLVS